MIIYKCAICCHPLWFFHFSAPPWSWAPLLSQASPEHSLGADPPHGTGDLGVDVGQVGLAAPDAPGHYPHHVLLARVLVGQGASAVAKAGAGAASLVAGTEHLAGDEDAGVVGPVFVRF